MISALGRMLSYRIIHHPVFVVGGGRSGTSILLQALGKHPHILSAPGESPLLTSMGGMVFVFEFEAERRRQYYKGTLRFTKKYLFNQLRRLSFEVAFGADYGCKFLMQELCKNPKHFVMLSRWAAKTFPTENVAKGLLKLFPESKFLYIVRNGVDVVASATRYKGFKALSFDENCKRWRDGIEQFGYLENFNASLALRHEDLLNDPAAFFEKVFSFIGEPNVPGVRDFVSTTIIHPLDQPTFSGGPVKDSFASRLPAHETWSQTQKTAFLSICSDAMEKAGYSIPF